MLELLSELDLLMFFRDGGSSSITSVPSMETNMVTVLDIQNKFIVLQTRIPDVVSVLSEWGSLYVLSGQVQLCLFHLQEKDLQSKLGLLFKKNLYDVAIRYGIWPCLLLLFIFIQLYYLFKLKYVIFYK